MWKFLPGGSKRESKQKVDTCESNKAYDAIKRKRTFQPYWLQMYKWLLFDGESQLMSCDWCKTRCCTLRRAKNTPTHSFVSRTVNRK
jgi:hypothetical protein